MIMEECILELIPTMETLFLPHFYIKMKTKKQYPTDPQERFKANERALKRHLDKNTGASLPSISREELDKRLPETRKELSRYVNNPTSQEKVEIAQAAEELARQKLDKNPPQSTERKKGRR